MQDKHPAGGGGGGSLFGSGDRRLRQHHHSGHHPNHHPLKCPRCESIKTKFCYYNNYNLSQPRHFCKNCRRYWTNGGVLRNVPVGGGCRKNKRSKQKVSPETATLTKDNSHSSSESSSLTATTVAAENQTPDGGVFSDIGTFTTMINSTNEAMGFDFGDIPDLGSFPAQYQAPPNEISSELLDATAQGGGGFGAVDWQGGGDQSLFDLFNAVDHAYWNQNQWNDRDHSSLFLP